MAVFTKISESDVSPILQDYKLGKLCELIPIEEGTDNSNYMLKTDGGNFILTLYEERINRDDLPFYIQLLHHLSSKGFPCPKPLQHTKGDYISTLKDRPMTIVTFMQGKGPKSIKNFHLESLGTKVAQLHNATEDFSEKHDNTLSLNSWLTLFEQTKDQADDVKLGLANEIEDTLGWLEENWPHHLKRGVIHADLFPDNVFFQGQNVSGVIDFYFACHDFYIYDLAICLNAWCFEQHNEFNITKAGAFLHAYNQARNLQEEELEALPILASGAAIRFLLTRLYQWQNHNADDLLTPKNPLEYLYRVRFHHGIPNYTSYGFRR